jgi:hypothetical protein
MQPRSICAFVAALAVSTSFASQSSGAGAGKITTTKGPSTGVSTAPLLSTQKAPSTANAIRINPQPLPPLEGRSGVQSSRAGGDPPTVIDRR